MGTVPTVAVEADADEVCAEVDVDGDAVAHMSAVASITELGRGHDIGALRNSVDFVIRTGQTQTCRLRSKAAIACVIKPM